MPLDLWKVDYCWIVHWMVPLQRCGLLPRVCRCLSQAVCDLAASIQKEIKCEHRAWNSDWNSNHYHQKGHSEAEKHCDTVCSRYTLANIKPTNGEFIAWLFTKITPLPFLLGSLLLISWPGNNVLADVKLLDEGRKSVGPPPTAPLLIFSSRVKPSPSLYWWGSTRSESLMSQWVRLWLLALTSVTQSKVDTYEACIRNQQPWQIWFSSTSARAFDRGWSFRRLRHDHRGGCSSAFVWQRIWMILLLFQVELPEIQSNDITEICKAKVIFSFIKSELF